MAILLILFGALQIQAGTRAKERLTELSLHRVKLTLVSRQEQETVLMVAVGSTTMAWS